MTQSAVMIILSALSVFGMIFILEICVRLLLFKKDVGTTIKIIRRQASELEYAVRASQNMLECALQPRETILLVVCEDEDAEAQEIILRLNEEYSNIFMCSEERLPQEIMRLAGLQMHS